jgi:predicted amidohydrolase YtcJ
MSNENLPVLVVNARIATGNPRRPWAEAALVVSGEVVFVGGGAEAAKRAGAGGRTVHANGRELTLEEAVSLAQAPMSDG